MTKGNIVYKFFSRSQHILIMSHQGRRYKVKFSTPYNGAAYFFTSDERLAQKIRATFQFRQGIIKEEAPEVEPVKEPEKKPVKQEKKAPEAPSWTKSMTGTKPPTAKATKSSPSQETVAEPIATPETPSAPAAGESSLFETIKMEEVSTYMDAKAYLRDVVGVAANEIRTKDEVVAYCQQHGINFPNYQL